MTLADRLQSYVSDELTHFVGRALQPDEDAQYELLISILKTGRLWPGGMEGVGVGIEGMWSQFGDTSLCDESMFMPNVVCFCDIPVQDLGLHMRKYSRFGLAFNKAWLIPRGVNPVFYLATGPGTVPGRADEPVPRAEYFDKEVDAIYRALSDYQEEVEEAKESGIRQRDERHELFRALHHSAHFFLQFHVFSFIKCFDASLAEDDPGNFYMEREWRVHGSVSFDVTDVSRVIMPVEFHDRFRAAIEGYAGEVTAA
jgi:hypothetical protein